MKCSFLLCKKRIFYWSVVDLQCCVSFRCIAQWFSYTYIICIYISFSWRRKWQPTFLFQILFPNRGVPVWWRSRLTSPGPLSPRPLCTLWFRRLARHAPLRHLKGCRACLFNASCNDVCRPKWVKLEDPMGTTWAPVLQLDHFFLPFLFLGKLDGNI